MNQNAAPPHPRIVYRSSTGTREHAWTKIERLVETKDFVILMAGTLPLLSLPKAAFADDALAFLRERIVAPKSSSLVARPSKG